MFKRKGKENKRKVKNEEPERGKGHFFNWRSGWKKGGKLRKTGPPRGEGPGPAQKKLWKKSEEVPEDNKKKLPSQNASEGRVNSTPQNGQLYQPRAGGGVLLWGGGGGGGCCGGGGGVGCWLCWGGGGGGWGFPLGSRTIIESDASLGSPLTLRKKKLDSKGKKW